MVNPQLVNYIANNFRAGFSKEDTEKALLQSGWSATDIQAAFYAIEHPAPTPTVVPPPVPTAQEAVDAETKRIQEELERENSKNGTRRSRNSTVAPGEKGIIGILMRMGLAKNIQQANMIMIGISLVCIGLAVYFIWPKSSTPPKPATLTIPTPPDTSKTK